jgi:hypothetical protein
MMIQNNHTPLVILALVIMTGCVLAGMLLGNVGPFNSETTAARMQITQTQASINSFATQSALEAIQTQQFPIRQQTVMAAEMTAVPLQKTATAGAESILIQSAYMNATQTAIASYSQNGQLLAQATQTAISNELANQRLATNATATVIVQNQIQEQTESTAKNIISVLGATVVSVWLLVSAVAKALNARAKDKTAHTQLLAEQRRLLALRAKIQAQKAKTNLRNPIPTSLIKKISGNSRGLPRAE